MNVVPALTADRAESVLHDITMARVRSGSGSPAATPAAEPPSLVAEHEANDLLDKGDQAKATAKFVESEKLRDKESGRAAIGQAAIGQTLATAAPAVDASIQKSSDAEPATEPLLAAPGANGSPTPDKPAAPALDSQPKPEPPAQGDAPGALAPGAAGSPTPDKPAAPTPDSQPKPEPPAQGDALAAPGAAGSPTPDQPAAPALASQPKPEPPAQGDAPGALAPGAAGSPTPDQPAAPAPDSTCKSAQSLPHNRENARALLREARAALANHQIDQAEAIAQEVKSWNLSYSFFGDNPDKVAAAARALRRRDKEGRPG
jgi:hypothetical protein